MQVDLSQFLFEPRDLAIAERLEPLVRRRFAAISRQLDALSVLGQRMAE